MVVLDRPTRCLGAGVYWHPTFTLLGLAALHPRPRPVALGLAAHGPAVYPAAGLWRAKDQHRVAPFSSETHHMGMP